MLTLSDVHLLACGPHRLHHGGAQLGRRVRHPDSGCLQGFDLVLGRALAARDDGAGVAHAAPRRGRDARNEGHHGLVRAVLLNPVCRLLFRGTADLANHDDTFSLRILGKALQAVDEIGAVEGVAANAHAGALAHAGHRGLVHRLICQSARPADDTDLACLVNITRHNAHLALTRLDDARAVRTNQARLVLAHQCMLDLHHVLLRDALGDAHDQRDLSLQGLEHRGGRGGGRHVNHRGVGTCLLLCLHAVGEDGQIHVLLTTLLLVHTAHHVGSILDGLFGVEGALPSGHPLANDLGVLVDPHLGS
mmetsp:Transcript_11109/g.26212  ORF Transcript_11109/g.26212 Transcript_11109/m.26212 type:complete len:306 (+) Transcript_11109:112-1029(+)